MCIVKGSIENGLSCSLVAPFRHDFWEDHLQGAPLENSIKGWSYSLLVWLGQHKLDQGTMKQRIVVARREGV
jgi:hypothetical protein